MKNAASSIADRDYALSVLPTATVVHAPRRASSQPTFGLVTAFDIGFVRAKHRQERKDPKIPICSIRSYRMITVFRSLPSLLQRGDYIQSATSVSVASQDAQARHPALAFLTPAPVRRTRTGPHSLRASASGPQEVNPGQMDALGIDHVSPMAEPNDYVDIIPPEIKQHILYGDGSGSGGHMWPGQHEKSVFPQSWGGR